MRKSFPEPQRHAFVFLRFLILSLFFLNVQQAQAADGKALFKANCASCHKPTAEKSTGPGLKGVLDRIPSGDWVYNWVHNSSAVIKSGDAYAKKRFEEFGGTTMTPNPQLSKEDIDAIIAYVNPGDEPVITNPGKKTPTPSEQNEEKGVDPFWVLLIAVGVLLILTLVLRSTKRSLKNVVNEKQGLPTEPDRGIWESFKYWCEHNKRVVAVIILYFICVGVKTCWYSIKDIGVYGGTSFSQKFDIGVSEDYHPSQPINFSHKIHAGDNGIQCVYCHSGAEKSKTAGVPSVNICMNCHKGISSTANPGSKEEIAKIYAAAGWDAANQKYTGEQKPLVWNKVHVLPDFVFFPHSQHVMVGKVECETCHGNVKEMTTVKQFSPLTMGWCIDCHRTTEVKMEGNPYYEKLHAALKAKYGKQPITVAKMGGLDCAKCHY
ncbi:MAG TPA: c-type cytochrome [Bacteroidia bacterium]|jgi:cytochrome c2|nr:c-type cytochrome [Bacteroidia bacterium]